MNTHRLRPVIGDMVAFGYGSTVVVDRVQVVVSQRGNVGLGDVEAKRRHGGTVGVDEPEHGGDRRLGKHRATDLDVTVADVRRRRHTADLRRICTQMIDDQRTNCAVTAVTIRTKPRHPFNSPFTERTWVSRHQINLDFNEARDDWVAAASAGPYANHLHLAPDR